MTSQAFLDLSTRLVKDMKQWSEESTRRETLSPADLETLQAAALIVERVTVAIVVTDGE